MGSVGQFDASAFIVQLQKDPFSSSLLYLSIIYNNIAQSKSSQVTSIHLTSFTAQLASFALTA